jgi:hypothetical protein
VPSKSSPSACAPRDHRQTVLPFSAAPRGNGRSPRAFVPAGSTAACRNRVLPLAGSSPGPRGAGPAVITGAEATAVVPPRFRFQVDGFGNVVASPRRTRRRLEMRIPIEFEVFKNLFLSIAEEMGVTLCRTGFSPNIKERLDYSCAVYDAAGETIAQGDHMPVHLGAMPLSVRAAIDARPMAPGDIVMLNDPFHGGTHLPDITLVSPVFLKTRDAEADVLCREPRASFGRRRHESRLDAGARARSIRRA